jgi:hypothetical protein
VSPPGDTRAAATAWAGWLGAALNVAAVALLRHAPHAYRAGDLGAWHAELLTAPTATLASGWCFTLGLALLAGFGLGLPDAVQSLRPGWLSLGGRLFALGALLDAAGTLAPPLAALAFPTAGDGPARALLGLSLALDATFNVLLGLGLLAMALGLDRFPAWLRVLGAAAGLASLPLAWQLHVDGAADWLKLSGPLWLTWIAAAGVVLLRRRGALARGA